ncbi:MAG: 2-succinyl-5-enolpyruvyl-6-hydroxy-3-cyclohexene-1-carboxylic-acid synthase [Muribaculaceae bacterium]|nr:2-succinyl-5-enolpyruvyl-6-hydroxy-3-cyclohexene-1-carboxylic-acid synthase [Muribaculaceae bacterium]
MQTTDKISCRILASLLANNVSDVIVSPGSRNAPLITALEAEKSLRKTVVIDERSAAFIALGMAQETGPVALVCTSGTAPLNYAPALAEAYYRGIPLIAISADRPAEWIDQDDSQTIHQNGALNNVVKKSYDIPDSSHPDKDYHWMVNRTVNDAIMTCKMRKPGPVHINVQLKAPLNGTTVYEQLHERQIELVECNRDICDDQLNRMAAFARESRILVVAGFMTPNRALTEAVSRLNNLPNVTVMAETVSNLILPPECYSIDRVLSTLKNEEKDTLGPDIVITIGGALISRQVKEYLRDFTPKQHWSVGMQHTTVDPIRSLTHRIETQPELFIEKLRKRMEEEKVVKSDYADNWKTLRQNADLSAERFLNNTPWSDLKAFETIFRVLPQSINLHLSNGTAIRYNQLLAKRTYISTNCNRGVSGIDGSTSTAIGASMAGENMNVLVTGDMSFCYDISALNTPVPSNLRIIVTNNQGGGIFRFIGSTRALECRDRYLCAPPKVNFEPLAEAFGLEYFRAETEIEVETGIKELLDSPSAGILEIVTPGENGGKILTEFMNRQK